MDDFIALLGAFFAFVAFLFWLAWIFVIGMVIADFFDLGIAITDKL